MTNVRLKPWVIITFSILCLMGVLYYSYEVVIWFLHIRENHSIQEKLEENIVVIKDKLDQDKKKEYIIDFSSLKEQNPDTVAYIQANNMNIDYIVVKGENNQYYLNHNFEKKWNVAGWIFGDYHNLFDGTDRNLIIYGHNTKDGSMFDSLKNVLTKEWYENKDNHVLVLVTEKGTYYYQAFSSYSIVPEEYYIQTKFSSDEEFDSFVKTLKARTIYDYGVEVDGTDKIRTLSSCIGDGAKRVVLHAKLVDFFEKDF